MGTVRTTPDGPGDRTRIGNQVLARAGVASTAGVRAKLAAFRKAHAQWCAASEACERAAEEWAAAQRAVGAADAEQDGALRGLVGALVGEGAPRLSPLKGLSKHAPAGLERMEAGKEAKEIDALVRRVLAGKSAGASVKKAAAKAGKCAAGVVAAIEEEERVRVKYRAAQAMRNGVGQPWETALAYLKRAVRVAEDDGAKGLYEQLFGESGRGK